MTPLSNDMEVTHERLMMNVGLRYSNLFSAINLRLIDYLPAQNISLVQNNITAYCRRQFHALRTTTI